MPKYSVEEVLDIIQTLTADEKSQLQNQLPKVLSNATAPVTAQNSQSQSLGNITMGSGGNFGLNQASGNINSSQNNTQASVENTSLQEALTTLQGLKQGIDQSDVLNKLQKRTIIDVTIKTIEEEISKPQPDKGLVAQAIESMKQGLEGVIALAAPVTKVAELIAKAWMI